MNRPTDPVLAGPAFEKAVEEYLKKRQPDATPAQVAFETVRPSLVIVQGKEPEALGTGVILNNQGLILTCLHVVVDSTQLEVTFFDGFTTEARIIRIQPDNDLAILKPEIVPENPVAAIFSSSLPQIGDPVVAVGHPFGIVASVSQGVVSGIDREAKTEKGDLLTGLIQFDAAVNPGNSGGPLLNQFGEVVGIVASLLNPTEQSFFVGIGYAVTSKAANQSFDIPPW